MWEMGKEFWPDKVNGEGALEGEWSVTASDPAGVLAENPLGHALFMTYFDPVLSKPDFTTLRSMFQDNDQGLSGYVADIVAQAFVISFTEESDLLNTEDMFSDQLSLETELSLGPKVLFAPTDGV